MNHLLTAQPPIVPQLPLLDHSDSYHLPANLVWLNKLRYTEGQSYEQAFQQAWEIHQQDQMKQLLSRFATHQTYITNT